MTERLNGYLADRAAALVNENYSGVRAEWWWERRLGGGIAVCQELDPEALAREVAAGTGREVDEVRDLVRDELGLEDLEPVVLTFEVPGDATAQEAARALRERSATPKGIAAGVYRRIEELARG